MPAYGWAARCMISGSASTVVSFGLGWSLERVWFLEFGHPVIPDIAELERKLARCPSGARTSRVARFDSSRCSRDSRNMSPRPDASHTSVRVQIAGHVFDLHQGEVSRLVSRLEPAEIRDHFVEIRGRRYPVKQALGAATGLDLSDFTSQHARSALRRLGLPVGRLSSAHTGRAASRGSAAPSARRNQTPATSQAAAPSVPVTPADLAATLGGYQNRWVAIQRNQVITDQDSFSDTVAWLRASNMKADAVFLVPQDPERLLAGLAT